MPLEYNRTLRTATSEISKILQIHYYLEQIGLIWYQCIIRFWLRDILRTNNEMLKVPRLSLNHELALEEGKIETEDNFITPGGKYTRHMARMRSQ